MHKIRTEHIKTQKQIINRLYIIHVNFSLDFTTHAKYAWQICGVISRSFTLRAPDDLPLPEKDSETGSDIDRATIGVLPGTQGLYYPIGKFPSWFRLIPFEAFNVFDITCAHHFSSGWTGALATSMLARLQGSGWLKSIWSKMRT